MGPQMEVYDAELLGILRAAQDFLVTCKRQNLRNKSAWIFVDNQSAIMRVASLKSGPGQETAIAISHISQEQVSHGPSLVKFLEAGQAPTWPAGRIMIYWSVVSGWLSVIRHSFTSQDPVSAPIQIKMSSITQYKYFQRNQRQIPYPSILPPKSKQYKIHTP